MKSFIALVAALLTSTLTFASAVTYHYSGNNYTTINNSTPPAGTTFNVTQRVTGSLTFSAPLSDMAYGAITPVAFSFSNGVHTFTNLDTLDNKSINLEVIGGQITAWDIQFNDQFLYQGDPIGKQQNVLFTRNRTGNVVDGGQLLEMISSCCYSQDEGLVSSNAGTWTVPEPGSLGLVGAALLGAALVRRRRAMA